MDMNYYFNFLAVVETGSITAAAKKIHIAQSALSAQMKMLQQEFGVKLLIANRGVRKLQLTDAGKIFYQKVNYMCQLEHQTKEEMQEMAQGVGTLRICLSPSLSIAFIRNFLCDFSRHYPKIRFDLYEYGIVEQTQRLLNGVVEIGVASAPLLKAEQFEVLFTVRENLGVVFNKKNPWFQPTQDIYLSDLMGKPLCLSRGCSRLLIETCKRENLPINVMSISSTKTSAVTWARQGVGVAVIPISFSASFEDNLCCKVIRDERLVIDKTLVVVKDRILSPVAQNFIEYCKKRESLLF